MPAQISSAHTGPQMKSSSPVNTSVCDVMDGRRLRRSNVVKISWLKSFSASALIVSVLNVSRYPASTAP